MTIPFLGQVYEGPVSGSGTGPHDFAGYLVEPKDNVSTLQGQAVLLQHYGSRFLDMDSTIGQIQKGPALLVGTPVQIKDRQGAPGWRWRRGWRAGWRGRIMVVVMMLLVMMVVLLMVAIMVMALQTVQETCSSEAYGCESTGGVLTESSCPDSPEERAPVQVLSCNRMA